jgi:hypothetical protein
MNKSYVSVVPFASVTVIDCFASTGRLFTPVPSTPVHDDLVLAGIA